MMERRTPMRRVFPAPVFIALLLESGLCDNVSTNDSGATSQLPAVRVTTITTPVADVGQDVVAQVDVWADDESAAGDLAAALATYWDSLLSGTAADAYVSGVRLESEPRPFTLDNDTAPRYLFDVGARIYPQENA